MSTNQMLDKYMPDMGSRMIVQYVGKDNGQYNNTKKIVGFSQPFGTCPTCYQVCMVLKRRRKSKRHSCHCCNDTFCSSQCLAYHYTLAHYCMRCMLIFTDCSNKVQDNIVSGVYLCKPCESGLSLSDYTDRWKQVLAGIYKIIYMIVFLLLWVGGRKLVSHPYSSLCKRMPCLPQELFYKGILFNVLDCVCYHLFIARGPLVA